MTIRAPRFTPGHLGTLSVVCGGLPVRVDWATSTPASTSGRAAAERAEWALASSRGWGAGAACSVNFHHAVADKNCLISRTHTSNLGVVASVDRGVPEAAVVLALGVDVERAGRFLRPGIERHLLNAQDDELWRRDLLRAWVAKEAAFKALTTAPDDDPLMDAPQVLSQLCLQGEQFGNVGGTAYGIVQVDLVDLAGERVLLGLAVRVGG